MVIRIETWMHKCVLKICLGSFNCNSHWALKQKKQKVANRLFTIMQHKFKILKSYTQRINKEMIDVHDYQK